MNYIKILRWFLLQIQVMDKLQAGAQNKEKGFYLHNKSFYGRFLHILSVKSQRGWAHNVRTF